MSTFSIEKDQAPVACIDVSCVGMCCVLNTYIILYVIYMSIIYFIYFYYCIYEIDVLILYIPLYWLLPEDGDLSLKHVRVFKFTYKL
jgi:hypothetical protein